MSLPHLVGNQRVLAAQGQCEQLPRSGVSACSIPST